MGTYNVGEKAYFNNYGEDRQAEKVLRPGSGVTIVAEKENGLFEVEDKKGNKDIVDGSELKKAAVRMNAGTAEAAVKKEQESQEAAEAKRRNAIEEAEEREAASFLTTQDGKRSYTFLENEELKQEIEKYADHPLEFVNECWNSAQRSFFRLGGALAHIYFNKDYKTKYGYTNAGGFNQFIEEQLQGKLSARTARYYMKVYVWAVNLEIPEADIIQIGWTKASTIASVAAAGASKEQVYELVHFAKTNSGALLEEKVRKEYSVQKEAVNTEKPVETQDRETEASVMKNVTLVIHEDELEIVEQVVNHINRVYPEVAEKPMGAKLMVAMTEYLASARADQGAVDRATFVQYGEAQFDNVEVFIRDKNTGEVFSAHHPSGSVQIDIAQNQEQQTQVEATVS